MDSVVDSAIAASGAVQFAVAVGVQGGAAEAGVTAVGAMVAGSDWAGASVGDGAA